MINKLVILFKLIGVIYDEDFWRFCTHNEIIKSVKAVYKYQKWNIVNGYDIYDFETAMEQIKKDKDRYYENQSQVLEKLNTKDREISLLKSMHESEIIRLKDIIQAKQVQLDKLIADNEGE